MSVVWKIWLWSHWFCLKWYVFSCWSWVYRKFNLWYWMASFFQELNTSNASFTWFGQQIFHSRNFLFPRWVLFFQSIFLRKIIWFERNQQQCKNTTVQACFFFPFEENLSIFTVNKPNEIQAFCELRGNVLVYARVIYPVWNLSHQTICSC